MTDTPETPTAQQNADTVVEQAVERAANKVAQAATPNGSGHGPLLSKMGSITAVALIITVGLMNLAINTITRSDLNEHKRDFKSICQIIVAQAPPETAKDLAVQLAECLK